MPGMIGALSTALVVSAIMSTPRAAEPADEPADEPAPIEASTPRPNPGPEEPTNQPVPTVEVDVDDSDGSIGVGVVLPAGAGTSGTETSRPLCRWKKAVVGDFRDTPGGTPGEGERSTDQVVQLNTIGEVVHLGWWKTCDDDGPQFVWVTPTIDIQALIEGAAARARAATPVPVPDINPPPEAGSFVNLGLWLAIDNPGVTVARVDLGGEWAQVRATHAGFEVDFGNGDSVTCDGLGTPIFDFDTVEQGPCGYAYRLSSPEDEPYLMTITSTYNVSYTTSTGRSGTLSPLNRSTTFDYDIDEIQTIGISN